MRSSHWLCAAFAIAALPVLPVLACEGTQRLPNAENSPESSEVPVVTTASSREALLSSDAGVYYPNAFDVLFDNEGRDAT